MYHGTRDALPSNYHRLDLASFLNLVDAAARLGADYSGLAQVRKAREIQARTSLLGPAFRARAEGASDGLGALGVSYATGKTTAEKMVQAAVEAATLTGPLVEEARQHLTHATRTANAEGARLMREVTEEQWIAPLRVPVAAVLTEADRYADELGIAAPLAQQRDTKSTQHPWAPTRTDLQRLDVRHTWERLGEVMDRLDELHGIATLLRSNRIIPAVPGRDWCEDYRWLDLSVLRGSPAEPREFFLANRHHGGPGIYTAAELAERGRLPGASAAAADLPTAVGAEV